MLGRLRMLCFGLVVLAAQAALAGPRYVHVSWSAPDTATTLTVTWMSDSLSDSSLVQYGQDDAAENEMEGAAFQANDGLGVVHSVELADLEPATEYVYRVGGPGGGWSGEFGFTTGPAGPCAPFKFAAFGDNRPDVAWLPQIHWNPVLEETAQQGPAFFVHTGDIVKDGDDTGQWNTFFGSSEPYLSFLPFLPSIGNHDDGPGDGDSANYNQAFALPRNENSNTEDYYYFLYGNAIFVSLSSQTFSDGDPPFLVQAQWLDKVLTENPAKWKFVFFHHPIYSSHAKFDLIFTEVEFNHPPDENGQNSALVPVLDKHHVDIAFFGHNHYYERLGPMVMGPDPAQGKPVNDFSQGTVYVITGGGGAFVYDEFDILGIKLDLIDWVCGAAAGSQVCAGDLHYVTVEIEDNVLHYEARATAEQMFGNSPANQKLLDSFDIVKEPTPLCVPLPPEPVAEEPVVAEQPYAAEPIAEAVEHVEIEADVVSTGDLAGQDVATNAETVSKDSVSVQDTAVETAGEALTGEASGSETSPHSEDTSANASSGCGCRTSPGVPPVPGGAVLPAAAALAACLLLRRRRAGGPGP